LLYEIEKAHPYVFNILLQVMDHGKMNDHKGKTIDCRKVILIMTTNAGASDMAKAPIGFARTRREGEDTDAIEKLFTPEFRNRLDATIAFAPLSPAIISRVVEKFVFQLEAQLADRDVTIELTEDASAWLAARGYDEKYGARPLARVIQEHIKKPLAEELLFGKLENGGTVRVFVEPDETAGESSETFGAALGKKLGFEFIAAPKAKPKGKPRIEKPKKAKALVGPDEPAALPGPDEDADGDGGGDSAGDADGAKGTAGRMPSVPLKDKKS
ncbi:MAG: AAA family ATPase, partial [Pseudomonadota bacterium]